MTATYNLTKCQYLWVNCYEGHDMTPSWFCQGKLYNIFFISIVHTKDFIMRWFLTKYNNYISYLWLQWFFSEFWSIFIRYFIDDFEPWSRQIFTIFSWIPIVCNVMVYVSKFVADIVGVSDHLMLALSSDFEKNNVLYLWQILYKVYQGRQQ